MKESWCPSEIFLHICHIYLYWRVHLNLFLGVLLYYFMKDDRLYYILLVFCYQNSYYFEAFNHQYRFHFNILETFLRVRYFRFYCLLKRNVESFQILNYFSFLSIFSSYAFCALKLSVLFVEFV